jgi:hypothetical protein
MGLERSFTAPKPVWPGVIDGNYYGREQLKNFTNPGLTLRMKVSESIAANVAAIIKHHIMYFWPGSGM